MYKKILDNVILYICVPNSISFHKLWAYESGLINNLDDLSGTALKLQQNTTFSLKSLKNLCCSAGFHIIDSGSYFIKPFDHANMYRLIKAKIITNNLLEGLYKLSESFQDNGDEIFVLCRSAK